MVCARCTLVIFIASALRWCLFSFVHFSRVRFVLLLMVACAQFFRLFCLMHLCLLACVVLPLASVDMPFFALALLLAPALFTYYTYIYIFIWCVLFIFILQRRHLINVHEMALAKQHSTHSNNNKRNSKTNTKRIWQTCKIPNDVRAWGNANEIRKISFGLIYLTDKANKTKE